MKRKLAAFLCVLQLFLCAACAREEAPEPRSPVRFYYKKAEVSYEGTDGVIAPEEREAYGHEGQLDWLLDAYFAGPVSETLAAPFRKETRLERFGLEDGALNIVVSKELGELSGIDLTIACACIARTCLELEGIETVTIRAERALLDGKQQITFSGQDISLMDDGMQRNSRTLNLYFTDEEHRYLLPAEIKVLQSEVGEMCKTLVQRLIDGPTDDSMVSPLPRGTRVLDVSVQGEVCSVNFSSEFVRNGFRDEVAQRTALLSVIDTLTQLENVETVEFYEEGNLLVNYGYMDLSTAWHRDDSIIGLVRPGVNEFEADLCVGIGSQLYLAKIPVKLRRSANESAAALAVGALLGWTADNGFVRVVPEGTALLSAVAENGLCTVNLSAEFLSCDSREAQTLAIRSVVGTLCSLEEVDRVRLLVEGAVPKGEYSDLFEIQTSHNIWFF